MPKSTKTIPSSATIRFAGFTSRWTICCAWMYASASQAWVAYSTARAGGSGPVRASTEASVGPRTRSMTSKPPYSSDAM